MLCLGRVAEQGHSSCNDATPRSASTPCSDSAWICRQVTEVTRFIALRVLPTACRARGLRAGSEGPCSTIMGRVRNGSAFPFLHVAGERGETPPRKRMHQVRLPTCALKPLCLSLPHPGKLSSPPHTPAYTHSRHPFLSSPLLQDPPLACRTQPPAEASQCRGFRHNHCHALPPRGGTSPVCTIDTGSLQPPCPAPACGHRVALPRLSTSHLSALHFIGPIPAHLSRPCTSFGMQNLSSEALAAPWLINALGLG